MRNETQPFTPPTVRPDTRYFCMKMKSITTGIDTMMDPPNPVQICTLRPPSIKLSHRSMRRCFSLIRKPTVPFLRHQVGRIRSRRIVKIVARSCILNQVVAITYRTFRSNYLLYGNDAGIDRGPAGSAVCPGLSCQSRERDGDSHATGEDSHSGFARRCLEHGCLQHLTVSIEDKDHLYGETDIHAPGIIEALIHGGLELDVLALGLHLQQ